MSAVLGGPTVPGWGTPLLRELATYPQRPSVGYLARTVWGQTCPCWHGRGVRRLLAQWPRSWRAAPGGCRWWELAEEKRRPGQWRDCAVAPLARLGTARRRTPCQQRALPCAAGAERGRGAVPGVSVGAGSAAGGLRWPCAPATGARGAVPGSAAIAPVRGGCERGLTAAGTRSVWHGGTSQGGWVVCLAAEEDGNWWKW